MSQMTVPFKVLLEDTGEEITFILSHDDAEKSAKARKPSLTQGAEQANDGNTPVLHPTNDSMTPNLKEDLPTWQSSKDLNNFKINPLPFASLSTSTIHTNSYRNTQNSSKISPSSIPNPNPCASTTKQSDNYPTYGGYLYSIPGYSAFQPLQYSNLSIISQNGSTNIPLTSIASEPFKTTDYIQLTSSSSTTSSADVKQEPQIINETTLLNFKQEDNVKLKPSEIFDEAKDKKTIKTENIVTKIDFEDQFATEFISPHPSRSQSSETKNPPPLLSTAQNSTSGLLKCEPNTTKTNSSAKTKSKQTERFSLKTSIPISKIDMKCVSTPPDSLFQSMFLTKVEPKIVSTNNLTTNNPPVSINSTENLQKITIQSNILLRGTPNVPIQHAHASDKKPSEETTSVKKLDPSTLTKSNGLDTNNWTHDNICDGSNTVTNADLQTNQTSNTSRQPPLLINDTVESIEPKKQIVFIPKRPNNSQQLLLAISQTPTNTNQVIVKRNITPEPKNSQIPSRLSQNPNKKGKDSLLLPEPVPNPPNKVVALKRLHQDNGDENDFENLITENQIYGNKIVVKEKTQNNQNIVSQGHEGKSNDSAITNIEGESDPPSIYLHPNFLYLNNIQFTPQFMMMNSAKIVNNSNIKDCDEEGKNIDCNENKQSTIHVPISESCIVRNLNSNQNVLTLKTNDVAVIKPSNTVLESLPTQSNDSVIQQPNQKVCSTNPQMIYHIPMVIDPNITAKSLNPSKQATVTKEFNIIMKSQNNLETRDGSNKASTMEYDKIAISSSTNEQLFIACPFQGEKNSQPKILITNLKTNPPDTETISTIDMAEKRKRLRRLKYLAKRDPSKVEAAKQKSSDKSVSNIISPFDIKLEIQKEFMDVKLRKDLYPVDSESDTEDAVDYNKIAELCKRQVGKVPLLPGKGKVNFLKTFGLTTKHDYREKEIEKLEKSLQMDSVASACISVGRLDWIHRTSNSKTEPVPDTISNKFTLSISSDAKKLKSKHDSLKSAGSKFKFLAQLNLTGVPRNLRNEYERIWQKVIEDRKKRSGETAFTKYCDDFSHYNRIRIDEAKSNIDCHTQGQLKIMTEIKKSVNENNKLIKQRLDTNGENSSTTSESKNSDINLLADINLSELCKLSKMADKSVKMLSGQKINKHLNVNKTSGTHTDHATDRTQDQDQNSSLKNVKTEYNINENSCSPKHTETYPKISIPNVSKIISLKSLQDPSVADTSPATSMDEPQNSAAGTKMENSYIPPSATIPEDCTPFAMQANYLNYGFNAFSGCYDGFYRKHNMFEWPGIDAIVASYRRYDAASHQERLALYAENLHLKHELAARQSEAAVMNDNLRQDIANKQTVEVQEADLRAKIQRLHDCMDSMKSIS